MTHTVLRGHRDVVSFLSFSPDGAWLYSASWDGEVWRWDVAGGTGEPIEAFGYVQ